jgi:nucleotide-binding universal stress UspA family protein
MEIKKILWPTDFSENAQKALGYVQTMTQTFGAEIHVLHVIPDLSQHKDWYGSFDQDHIDKIRAWEDKKVKDRLEQICSQYLDGCPLYIKHVAVGDPALEILKAVKKEGIDLVIMSTRGAQGYFHSGGVFEKMVKYSPVPVIMVPLSGEAEQPV